MAFGAPSVARIFGVLIVLIVLSARQIAAICRGGFGPGAGRDAFDC
jgi:hypothetical protein